LRIVALLASLLALPAVLAYLFSALGWGIWLRRRATRLQYLAGIIK
jgi:type III secretory pathway component EscT